jgi:Protein of unknown function (DUF3128)
MSSADPEEEMRKSLSCLECANALAYCFGACPAAEPHSHPPSPHPLSTPRPSAPGPRHQFAHYWREGEFDACKARMRELWFCVEFKQAKGERLRAMAKELVTAGESTTEGTIWTPRDRSNPGIDFPPTKRS